MAVRVETLQWAQILSGPKSFYTLRDIESSLATETIAKVQKPTFFFTYN